MASIGILERQPVNDIMDMSERMRPIVVVDDDTAVRKALGRLLSALGHRVCLFDSAESFLGTAPALCPVCVLVDIDLGETSGLDLARELQKRRLNFPLVFITGSQSEAAKQQALALGCVAYLQKPLSETKLMDAIATALRGTSHCSEPCDCSRQAA